MRLYNPLRPHVVEVHWGGEIAYAVRCWSWGWWFMDLTQPVQSIKGKRGVIWSARALDDSVTHRNPRVVAQALYRFRTGYYHQEIKRKTTHRHGRPVNIKELDKTCFDYALKHGSPPGDE